MKVESIESNVLVKTDDDETVIFNFTVTKECPNGKIDIYNPSNVEVNLLSIKNTAAMVDFDICDETIINFLK